MAVDLENRGVSEGVNRSFREAEALAQNILYTTNKTLFVTIQYFLYCCKRLAALTTIILELCLDFISVLFLGVF